MKYEVTERPEAVRPIPGEEAVVYTCVVPGDTLTWRSEAFTVQSHLLHTHK